jgi:hypothetical protein
MDNPQDNVNVSAGVQSSGETYQPDIAALVDDTLALKELLQRETQWLREMKMDNVKAVHEDKLRLLRRLEIQNELIKRDPSALAQRTADQVTYLKALQAEMKVVTQENFAETLKAREINKRVVDVIAGAVNKYENRATGYTNTGIAYGNRGKQPNIDSSYAVSVNETI